jgi:hypothetical protein
MHIPHLTRPDTSDFYPVVRDSLPAARPLPVGTTISCDLPASGGYAGDVVVDIFDGPEFGTDWTSSDPDDWSRFPARIRAAATALRDSGLRGSYRITHKDGAVTITAL